MRLHLGQRAWSMAARHHAPPQAYVGLLSSCPLRQRRAMDQMGNEWATLLMLEQRRLVHQPACRLWKDLSFVQTRPLRLLWALCEGFKGDLDCDPVKRLLRGLLDTFPDNKIVEDVHNFVKLDAQKSRKQRRCEARQADAVVHSGVLESGGIPHPAKAALKSCLGYVRLVGSFWVDCARETAGDGHRFQHRHDDPCSTH